MTDHRRLPTNVRRFLWLWFGSFLVSIGSIPWQPQESGLGAEFGRVGYMEMLVAMELLGLLILLPFVWLAAWRRKNWARWVLTGLTLLSVPLLLVSPNGFFSAHPLATVCTMVATVIDLASIYFLFVGDARDWFQRPRSN